MDDTRTIGWAVSQMRSGHIVARTGWNGKNMGLYLVPANTYPTQTEAARGEFGDEVPYREYVAMFTAQGDVVPWVCSQSDLLADDWYLVRAHVPLDNTDPDPEA
jgi:hypothetical protein